MLGADFLLYQNSRFRLPFKHLSHRLLRIFKEALSALSEEVHI